VVVAGLGDEGDHVGKRHGGLEVCKLVGLFDGYVRAVTAEAPSFQTRQRRYYFSSA
jgi:hypothetical protein